MGSITLLLVASTMTNKSMSVLSEQSNGNSQLSLFHPSATVVDWKFFLSSLRIYVIAFFTCIGLILNSICILINMKFNFKLKSVNLNKTYIVGLAIFDLIKLLVECAFPLAELNYNWLVTDQWCQIRYWLKYTSGEMCSWILVVMSIDRILVFLGHKYSKFTALKSQPSAERAVRRNSLLIVAILFCVFSIINSVFFLKNTIYSVMTNDHILKCQNNHRGFGLHVFQHTWFNLTWFQTFYSFAYSFLPAAILIVTNAIIIKIIRKYSLISRRFVRSNTKKMRKLKESGLVLIFLSAFFLISTLPVQISILFIDIHYRHAYHNDLAHCFYYFFSMVEASNHSCNFLIYILIDKAIRNQFLVFFKQ